MDTRTPSPRPRTESTDGDNAEYQPDLSQEVSLLSTKLINAINYQTNLDDSLQHTRHELEAANRENARLKAEKKSLDDMITSGILIRKSAVDKTMRDLRAEVAKERAAREEAEKARKQTDAELENLTTALFEEANTMVAAARKDTEAVEKRNSQLKGQIHDTEMLLASQQEQLQDLKLTMGRMSERGDNDTAPGRDSIPSTPIGSTAAIFEAMQLSPNATSLADIPPEHPLFFSQLLTPILRSDIPAYIDFQDLLQSARKAMSHSRAGSTGNSSSGGLSSSSQSNLASSSSPSLPGAFSFSTTSSPQSVTLNSSVPPLKDSKFYKRSLVEDIEPTLRLDLAPGLSFLSRRTVLSSLLQGSMVVEPFMPQTKFYGPIFSCALCGESRKNEPYVRKHRFRTSEEDSAQRYPLCDYCLGRTRAAGDFVGFLRMVRDGHWRAESEEEQKSAWEEAVRLRERMFWARQGGGVIPSLVKQETPSTANPKSARPSLEGIPEHQSPAQEASRAVQAAQAEVDQSNAGLAIGKPLQKEEDGERPQPDEKLLDVLKNHRQSMNMGPVVVGAEDMPPLPQAGERIPVPEVEVEERDAEVEEKVVSVENPVEKPVEKPTIITPELEDVPVQPAVAEPQSPEPEPLKVEHELEKPTIITPELEDVPVQPAVAEPQDPAPEPPKVEHELEKPTIVTPEPESVHVQPAVAEPQDPEPEPLKVEQELPSVNEPTVAVAEQELEQPTAHTADVPVVVTEAADEQSSEPTNEAPAAVPELKQDNEVPQSTEATVIVTEVEDDQASEPANDIPIVTSETAPSIIPSKEIDEVEQAAREPVSTTVEPPQENHTTAETEIETDELAATAQQPPSTTVDTPALESPKEEEEAPPAADPTPLSPPPTASAQPSLSAPSKPTERRGSSVLDRVRAMNAKAQEGQSPTEEKKLPGSFD
ncbi:hypothetical protein L1887_59365 [Cichorium endivia]|nr:hypothetical protein L1887_59365 [Cichorium endivia]